MTDVEREGAWRAKGVRGPFTVAQYDQLHEDQDGRCALCLRPPREGNLVPDHDHDTGRVRELLCDACNWALGHLEPAAWGERAKAVPCGAGAGRVEAYPLATHW